MTKAPFLWPRMPGVVNEDLLGVYVAKCDLCNESIISVRTRITSIETSYW